MKSVLSFPDRGPWGDAKWRGNCSGHIQRELIEHFKPKLFVDVCEGSGTSRDVCRDIGIEYVGFDLHGLNGAILNDFTKDYVLSKLLRPADLCFSHPPYHDIIKYSGEVYPRVREGDTSRCLSPEEFIEKSQVMLLNQREATRNGGVYATLIGDTRRGGKFKSYQADFIKMMPESELISVTIKEQHNCLSDGRVYNGNFIPILHEYLLIWQKSSKSLYAIGLETATEKMRQIASTWRAVIRIALMKLGGTATLKLIYDEVAKAAGDMVAKNSNWQAKVRQQLQIHFTNVERGVWAC